MSRVLRTQLQKLHQGTVHTMQEDENVQLRRAQEEDPLRGKVRDWVTMDRAPPLMELRGKEREVLRIQGQFSTELFQIVNGLLVFQKHADRNKGGDAQRICLPQSKMEEVFNLCHSNAVSGHRGINRTTAKFNRSFYMVSTGENIEGLIKKCVPCLAKIRSLPESRGEHVPSMTGTRGKSRLTIWSHSPKPLGETDTYYP